MNESEDLHIPFTWAERRPILLKNFLYLPPCTQELHDPKLFSISGLMIVEYCSGNGQWIAEAAKREKGVIWIAVEKQFERARSIWKRIVRESLDHLFIVCGDAMTFSQYYLREKSIEEVFINFPDPWPKRKHAKHRVIQRHFVQELERTLKPGGRATLVTDDIGTSERIIREFSSWKNRFAPHQFITEWPDFGSSFFHTLWTKRGCTIRYHRFSYGD